MPSAQQPRRRTTSAAAALAGAACLGGSVTFSVAPVASDSTLAARHSVTSAGQSEAALPSDRQPSVAASGVAAIAGAGLVGQALGAKRGSAERRRARTATARNGILQKIKSLFGGKTKAAPLVVISGPPAAGKGTQCEKIKEKYGYVHISTGDMLRENVKNGTELGKKAKGYMEAGALVPSELLVDIVKDRLAQPDVQKNGCLLDGFPRAPDQAQAMVDAGLNVEKFLLIEVPDEELVVRGVGRRLDPETGDIYHMTFKPPPTDIVDRLVHRSDDQEEAIRNRLKIYRGQVDDILPFFKDVVVEINGVGKPTDVFDSITKDLDKL